MDDKSRQSTAGQRTQSGLVKGRRQPVVGEDVPDESKERHTEIAVEAGRHDGLHKDNKTR